jgi:hypothetical protein
MSLSLYPRELKAAQEQGWCEVSGAGFGCLLIKRGVLERVPFRDAGNAPDLPFAQDCVRQKIKQIGRTDVVCGHIETDENNVTLWPFEGGYGMVARVYALQDVVLGDNGVSVEMKKGRYYSISTETAKEAARAGFLRITNEADVVADEMAGYETATSPQAEARETAVAPTARKRKPRKPKSSASGG